MKLHGNKSRITFVRLLMITCFLIIGTFVLDGTALKVHAQGTATVAAASGKIRESADTSSSVMASVKQNDKLDITAQTTSGDGYTWYKVFVDGSKQGYIRADLVNNVEGSIPKESADAAKSSSSDDKSNLSEQSQITEVGSDNKKAESTADDNAEKEQNESSEPVSVSPSTVIAAKVIGATVRVRETPSTKGKVKGSAKVDTEVTVSGETTDADGKTWYQVSYNSGDSTVNGFIRSDFLEATQTAEPTTVEAETEAPVEEVPENNDYEVKYEENDEGTMEWFLYDNLKGTKQSINNIYEIVKQSQDSETSDNDQLKKMKIILIVMAAVILLLVIAITILLFKVRDTYDAYDDEDEDDEEEEEEIVSVKRKKPSKKSSRKQSRRKYYEDDEDEDDEDEDDEDDEDEYDEEEEEVIRPARKNGRVSQNVKATNNKKSSDANWQSKNFLDVDDDMEFEFLDIK